jgi:pimeloyl-ACP methyl ester carboxylesterase
MPWSILFLHGIGDSFRDDTWYEALAASLEKHGVDPPKLSSSAIIRPDYAGLFAHPPTSRSGYHPDSTQKEPGSGAEKQERRSTYQRAQHRAVHDLTGTCESHGWRGFGEEIDPSWIPTWAPYHKDFEHAQNYVSNKYLRSAVLDTVLAEVGTRRDLLIIGHSLGSLVGIDLLAHLPRGVQARRLVTIGSPAGAVGMYKQNPEALLRSFPYHQVHGWVNVLAPHDLVTRGRGINHLFPAAVDVRIPLGISHGAAQYLAHPAVAKLIADPLRPRSTHARAATAELDIPLTPTEKDAVDAMLFAQLLLRQKKDNDAWRRYTGAASAVRESSVLELIAARERQGAPVPNDLRLLLEGKVDKLGFSARPMDEALYFAVVAGTNNPVAPYELDTEKEQLRALEHLWSDVYGYTQASGATVVRVLREAREVYDSNWKKYVLGAAGLALLVAAPIGIAGLAAASGLAGAAALTTSLAAFGPGGMVGGMALAAGLIGVGSGTVTAAVTASSMSPEMLQTQCVRLMSYAKGHQALDLDGDRHAAWRTLVTWHSELASELARIEVYSDEGAPGVRSLKQRVRMLTKAIDWMTEQGLAPELPSESGQ